MQESVLAKAPLDISFAASSGLTVQHYNTSPMGSRCDLCYLFHNDKKIIQNFFK